MADETTKPADNAGETDDVRARAVAEAEAAAEETPTPTQAELDAAKLGNHADVGKSGAYKTRHTKAN
ncbi:hypothetical protein LPN01_09655 [Sphingomonas sp. A2-49]|uniref:hypothetical protein n=1 Tax=Sphingomonas sp. A2-49 TaxID=1391375 RepID=UPI0021D21D45|nr:hypothetical protein [Sphingomonas sp. A2-49]MCU6454344.1 hypothetical protein [Sphingomonas sp. A2-49]